MTLKLPVRPARVWANEMSGRDILDADGVYLTPNEIAAALNSPSARDQALEEAAKIADSFTLLVAEVESQEQFMQSTAAVNIALAIRALKHTTPTGEQKL